MTLFHLLCHHSFNHSRGNQPSIALKNVVNSFSLDLTHGLIVTYLHVYEDLISKLLQL